MPRSTRTVLRQIDTLFNLGSLASLSDGQLLERFGTRQGEASELAFAALVERHGPMVLRVCRAFSTDPHDAQDAFQATFLVLVRKARSLWVKESLAPWLYAVAQRIARHLRADAARRRRFETEVAAHTLESYEPALPDPDAQAIHEELARLPEAFRAAIVLCDLAGQTHDQAARALGVPSGTVKSRLARGRAKLRVRLARRGLASAGLAAGTHGIFETASAGVPAVLAESTVIAATRVASVGLLQVTAGVVPASVIGLAQEGLSAMLGIKLKAVGLSLGLATIVATGAAGLAVQEPGVTGSPRRSPATETGSGSVASNVASVVPARKEPFGEHSSTKNLSPEHAAKSLVGRWTVKASSDFGFQEKGRNLRERMAELGYTMQVGVNTIDFDADGMYDQYVLDPSKSPAHIDLWSPRAGTPGIYDLQKETLRICLAVDLGEGEPVRPLGFEAGDQAPGSAARLYVLVRADDGKPTPGSGSQVVPTPDSGGPGGPAAQEDLARQLKRLQDENAALRARLDLALKAQADATAQAEQARQAEQVSRDRAVKNEALARAEADKASDVTKHLQLDLPGTLDGGSPEEKHVWSLLKRGLEEQKAGRLSPAENLYERARELAEESVKRQPDAVAPRALLARSLELQGSLKIQQGNTDQAGALFQQALEIERALIEKAPSNPDLREQFASSLTKLGTLLRKLGRLDQARAELERSRAVVEQLVRETPTRSSSRAVLADVLDELGELAQTTGRAAEAKDLRLKASAIRERLLQESQGEPVTPAAEPKAENRASEPPKAASAIQEQAARLDQILAENEQLREGLLKTRQADAEATARAMEREKAAVAASFTQVAEDHEAAETTARNEEQAKRNALAFYQTYGSKPSGSTTPWVHKYLPLTRGRTSENLLDFRLRIEHEAANGWEFAGSADVRLTSSEYEALAKGGELPTDSNEDATSSVYRVYIFRRPAGEANALRR